MRTSGFFLLPLALAALLSGCGEDRLCSPDERLCGEACVAVSSDPANCGACGNACDVGEKCSEGLCRCGDGRADCDGACVDVRSDPAHCGACGVACDGATLCTTDGGGATSCKDSCALPTQTACGRACVALADDPWNCGACGRACGTNERCAAGACVADLYLACYNSNEIREATRALEPAGLPVAVAPGPIALASLGDALYVASAHWTGIETISELRRDPPAVRATVLRELNAPVQDLQALAVHAGLLYVSHSSTGTLLVLAPDGAVVDELPLLPAGAPPDAKNPNPHGIAFAGDDAYVALNERNEVVILDVSGMAACARGDAAPPCASVVARIDVQPLASAGALARPSRLVAAGGRVYAALWNLDASWNPPAGSSGRLAAIDPATRALAAAVVTGGVAGLVDLGAGCLNPAGLALDGETLWVTCGAFDYSNYPAVAITGGGVVPVDLSGATPAPGAAIPAGPGEAPGNLAFCGGTGYVGDRNSGRVFRLDPAAGIVDGTELCPVFEGFAYVADLACGF
jgi:stigma-specific protein Stig1